MAESASNSMLSAVTEEHLTKDGIKNNNKSIITNTNEKNDESKSKTRKTRGRPKTLNSNKVVKNITKQIQPKNLTKNRDKLVETPTTSSRYGKTNNTTSYKKTSNIYKSQLKTPKSQHKRKINSDTEDTDEEIATNNRKKQNISTQLEISETSHTSSNIASRTRSHRINPQLEENTIQDRTPTEHCRVGTPTENPNSTSETVFHKIKKTQSKERKKGFAQPSKFKRVVKNTTPEVNTSRSLRSHHSGFLLATQENLNSPSTSASSGFSNSFGTRSVSKRQKASDIHPNSSPTNLENSHKLPNLGTRLSRGTSCKEPSYNSTDIQEQSQGLLRRSSRAKSSTQTVTTGSCVSSTAPANNNSSPSNITDSSLSRSAHRSGSNNKSVHLGGTASTSKFDHQTSVGGFDLSAGAGPSTSNQNSNLIGIMSSSSNNSEEQPQTSNNPFIKLQKGSLSLSGNQANLQQPTFGFTSTSTAETTSAAPADSESDDSEVGRLQALLEARGLPPHLFGALGPRMHHLLHRTMGGSSTSKAQILLQGLQSNDESQQLQAAIEMCQMLVMGNEDTLAGFPIKQVVPALINLLRMEHNFDIMINACRALAYMLEALPRSSATVVDAIPAFLEKLQVIQWVDVAEQSLTALEILSRRHNKAILQANGISACLVYLDFFSINAQRCALSITANCCQNLNIEEFYFVKESLPLLARLLSQHDKKSVESICIAFHRLVDSFQHDPSTLQEIASMELLKNCQQLLVVLPPVLNSATFTNVVRMLSLMCAKCPDLAITLLKNNIAATLLYLLTGSSETVTNKDVDLITRNPSELYEITSLIGELMPRLPTDGIFTVDALLERPNSGTQYSIQWQWKDDRNIWRSYSAIDSRMIEAAHLNSDEEISLTSLGRTYTIDYNSMTQINEDTGTTRMIQRKIIMSTLNQMDINNVIPSNMINNQDTISQKNKTTDILYLVESSPNDARIACLKEERGLASNFIKTLFSVLYEVYSSSAGPTVRYKCLRALLRMVYFANTDLLKEVLKNQLVSAHIAGMMASNDLRIVVGALQMAVILMQKLPDVFGVHFRREGVMHQINLLADPTIPICAVPSLKTGTLSAPPSASITSTSFDFENPVASTSKGPVDKSFTSNMFSATKMCISMPSSSSSASLLQTNSNSRTVVPHGTFESHLTPSNLVLSKNEPALSPDKVSNSNKNKQLEDSLSFSNEASNNERVNHLKMSDILKRKVPSKRGKLTSTNTRPRIRSDEQQLPRSVTSDIPTTADPQQSIMHELINKNHQSGSTRPNSNVSSNSSKSRFSGASLKTTSFLSSLNPARWGRTGSHNSFPKDQLTKDSHSIGQTASNSNFIAVGNREKARQWIREQSVRFVKRYPDQTSTVEEPNSAFSILSRLKNAIQRLDGTLNDSLLALQELRDILIESDISPFEVNHSGLIKAMINFMTAENTIVNRNDRLRAFLHVFSGLPLQENQTGGIHQIEPTSFSAFVAKLNSCVTQLEQFPVKVHDFPGGMGGRSNTSALKFFNTHQLKCNLQRHPECNNLRQWKGGTVKIDPLALVQAIERYLVIRGYGGIKVDSEEDSEDDIDNIDAAAMITQQSNTTHKLQFLIGDEILPYNMTVYQAIRQFSPLAHDHSETDTESETPIGKYLY